MRRCARRDDDKQATANVKRARIKNAAIVLHFARLRAERSSGSECAHFAALHYARTSPIIHRKHVALHEDSCNQST